MTTLLDLHEVIDQVTRVVTEALQIESTAVCLVDGDGRGAVFVRADASPAVLQRDEPAVAALARVLQASPNQVDAQALQRRLAEAGAEPEARRLLHQLGAQVVVPLILSRPRHRPACRSAPSVPGSRSTPTRSTAAHAGRPDRHRHPERALASGAGGAEPRPRCAGARAHGGADPRLRRAEGRPGSAGTIGEDGVARPAGGRRRARAQQPGELRLWRAGQHPGEPGRVWSTSCGPTRAWRSPTRRPARPSSRYVPASALDEVLQDTAGAAAHQRRGPRAHQEDRRRSARVRARRQRRARGHQRRRRYRQQLAPARRSRRRQRRQW